MKRLAPALALLLALAAPAALSGCSAPVLRSSPLPPIAEHSISEEPIPGTELYPLHGLPDVLYWRERFYWLDRRDGLWYRTRPVRLGAKPKWGPCPPKAVPDQILDIPEDDEHHHLVGGHPEYRPHGVASDHTGLISFPALGPGQRE